MGRLQVGRLQNILEHSSGRQEITCHLTNVSLTSGLLRHFSTDTFQWQPALRGQLCEEVHRRPRQKAAEEDGRAEEPDESPQQQGGTDGEWMVNVLHYHIIYIYNIYLYNISRRCPGWCWWSVGVTECRAAVTSRPAGGVCPGDRPTLDTGPVGFLVAKETLEISGHGHWVSEWVTLFNFTRNVIMMSEWEGSDRLDLLLILYFSPPTESLTDCSCKLLSYTSNSKHKHPT